jgi:hypothetical protein
MHKLILSISSFDTMLQIRNILSFENEKSYNSDLTFFAVFFTVQQVILK